jgi:arylsulfatase
MLTRARLPALVAMGLGIMLGYITASGQLDALAKNWAEDKNGVGRGQETTAERRAAVGASSWPRLPAQHVLPFPPTPSPSIAGRTMQDSVYKQRTLPRRLPKDAPNILIVLIDDVGPAQASTFGGLINTPTLDRIAKGGITYNRFHTTAMCSPTRSALLCGRNHHRVANGQIAELANDWDGYVGIIPKSSATVAEVLRNYGYATSAFGKWHNIGPKIAGHFVQAEVRHFSEWQKEAAFDWLWGEQEKDPVKRG